MRCEWPSCKKESFLTTEQFIQHLHHHCDDVKGKFVVPGACQWPGCRSRKSGVTFKTDADFDRHLKVHLKSHWCDVPGCKHREGFARRYDLMRHVKSHSKEREFKCPDSSCTSNSIGFLRKDKLDAHIKIRHPHLMNDVQSRRCNVHGCTTKKPFDTVEDLKAHFVTLHEGSRPYRCMVENCTRRSNGFTAWGKLVEHIKVEHNPPKCEFDHCDFRSLGDVMVKHHTRTHYDILLPMMECKLPGCEGSRSAFTFDRWLDHLADHHDIGRFTAELLEAASAGDTSYFNDTTFVPCKYCSEIRVTCNQYGGSTNDFE